MQRTGQRVVVPCSTGHSGVSQKTPNLISIKVISVPIAIPQRPAKKRKITQTPTELIKAIPPPLDYYPLPYLQINRQPEVRLPEGTETDLYSLFKLFLTNKHFETIAINTNEYVKANGANSDRKRPWWPTNAVEIEVFITIFIYIGVVRLPVYEDY